MKSRSAFVLLAVLLANAAGAADKPRRTDVVGDNGRPVTGACADAGTTEPTANAASVRCLLDAGRPGIAFLLAQRLLAAQPDDATLRALVADALAALGADPATADDFLPTSSPWASFWRGMTNAVRGVAWVGIDLGRDSNVNSATTMETVPIPLLNYRSLQLDPLLVRHSSAFLGINAGAAAHKPFTPTLVLGAQGMAAARLNSAEWSYLPHSYQGQVSLTKRIGAMEVIGELGMSQEWLARHQVADRKGVTGRLKLPRLAGWNAEVGFSTWFNAYPKFSGVRTVMTKGSAGLSHEPSGLGATIHMGDERASGDIKDIDRRFTGLALSWRMTVSDSGTLLARAGIVRSRYTVPSPLFASERRDTAHDFELAYAHRLDRDWTVTPRLMIEQNASSIPLVAFRRTQGMVELRRFF